MSTIRLRPALALGLLLAHVAPPAAAGGVYLLSAPDQPPLADLQSAVDAAVEGDTLIVAGGDYPGFTIDAKSLALIVPGTSAARVTGPVRIRNLASGQSVSISGLWVEVSSADLPTANSQGHALIAEDCAGHLRFQDCLFLGANWATDQFSTCGSFLFPRGGDGALFDNCARVSLVQCELEGGDGAGSSSCCCSIGGVGGHGLAALQSRLSIQECSVRGGQGGDNGAEGGDGGSGLRIDGGWIYATGSSFTGADGGYGHDFLCPVFGGDGGNGVWASAGTEVALQSCTLIKGLGGNSFCGNPGSGGLQFTGGGTLEIVPPPARTLRATSFVADDELVGIEVRGQPGDAVWLVWSDRPAWIELASIANAWLVPFPHPLTQAPQGVIPAGGVLSLSVPAGDVSIPLRRRMLQAMVRSSQGATFLTGVRHIAVVDRGAPPDCDGNASNDWLDVLAGGVNDCQPNLVPDACEPDCDGNGVPDECQIGNATMHVDPAAPPGGNGMPCAPFRTIAEAALAAPAEGTLLLHDGVYVGPDNRDVALGNKALTIRSQNGAAAAVIDLLGAGRAFRVVSPTTTVVSINPKIVLEGVTIANGSVSTGGGAVDTSFAHIELRDCEFTDNSAALGGGAVRFVDSLVTVRNCGFIGNASLSGLPGQGRGGAVLYEKTPGPLNVDYPLFFDCRFVDNAARVGGALLSNLPPRAEYHRVAFLGNSALEDGGALHLTGWQPADPMANCLFAGNVAGGRGGAVFASSMPNVPVIVNSFGCTFVHNQAGSAGGALFLAADDFDIFGFDRVFNGIVWANSAPVGPQIALATATTGVGPLLSVAHTDLQGGQAAIAVLNGSIQWGAGNLDVDPLFADPDGPDGVVGTFLDNDYRPVAGAPVNDAGWNSMATTWGIYDLDREPRLVEDPAAPNTGQGTAPIVDLGAYEFP